MVKWGVIGCSDFARRRSIPAMLSSKDVELVAICSRSQEKADSFAESFNIPRAYGSYDAMLQDSDIDAVHIPLPNSLHAEWSIKALHSGKHVLCEKPFTVTAGEAEQVRDVAYKTGLYCSEVYMWRLHPQHLLAKQLVDEGKIGELKLVRSSFSYKHATMSGLRLDAAMGGGCLLDVGCYPISAARYYFGTEPMQAEFDVVIHKQHGVDVSFAGKLKFPNGLALIDSSFEMPFRTEMELVGTSGRITFRKSWQPPEQATILLNEEEITLESANHYVIMFEDFSQAVLQKSPPAYSIDEAVKQMQAIDLVRACFKQALPTR